MRDGGSSAGYRLIVANILWIFEMQEFVDCSLMSVSQAGSQGFAASVAPAFR